MFTNGGGHLHCSSGQNSITTVVNLKQVAWISQSKVYNTG